MKNTTRKHLPVQYGALAVQQHRKSAAVNAGVKGAFFGALVGPLMGALKGGIGALTDGGD